MTVIEWMALAGDVLLLLILVVLIMNGRYRP